MNTTVNRLPHLTAISTLLLMLIASKCLSASTLHYIDFGGLNGYTYNPSSLAVEVGDTIVWRGNFSQYPLKSISVPPGAKPITSVISGTTYSYTIEIAGNYSYEDPIYSAIGMKGSFSAQILPHGSITNEGKDFYLGLITPSYNYVGSNGYAAFAVITTYYDNTVKISYFDASGKEANPLIKQVLRRHSIQVELDLSALRIDTNSEVPEYKTCHITSQYPISVQFISKGANSGGSYLALPVLGLGKNYVVASYNDNPGNGALRGYGLPTLADNGGGSFLIIGTEEGTNINIIPTTTTTGDHIGVNTGPGATGLPHPFTIGLGKGQSYLVRSNGRDAGADISGTIIQSSKPISVISGHEDAFIGDFNSSYFTFTEGRDYMIEQMLPVEYWDSTGYISLPFREATPPSDDGHGDNYRVFAFDNAIAVAQADVVGISGAYPMSASRFHFAEHLDITSPVDIYSTNGKKIGVTQYDERSQPPSGVAPSPSMMTIIPKSRWRTSYNFSLLQPKTIDGITEDQYVNIIADSLAGIRVSNDGAPLVPLATGFNLVGSFLNVSKQYHNITGGVYRMGPGSFSLRSDHPFIAYTYGMNKLVIQYQYFLNFNFENAAPAGTQLNTGVAPSFKISIDTLSKCSGWTICVKDTGSNDPGIKAVMLVDDTEGIYFDRLGMKFSNAVLDSTSPAFTSGELHPDYHSSDPYCFKVKFSNQLAAATAPVCIIDNLGNGMIVRLNRNAPTISFATSPVASLKPDSIFFQPQKIGDEICTTFVVKNTASEGGASILLGSANLKKVDAAFNIRSITPALPYILLPKDSVSVQLCYIAKDSVRHRDTLLIQTDCFTIPVSLDAHGATGLISSSDLNFGSSIIGDTICKNLLVKNVGSAPFTLTKSFSLSDNINFSVDTSKLPFLIPTGGSVQINICFHPKQDGPFTAGIDWSTDLERSFAHSIKSNSVLNGNATPKAGVENLLTSQSFTIHPNPASGNSVIVNFPSQEKATLIMFDVLGREVYKRDILSGISQIEIPVHGLSEGVYYMQMNSSAGSVTQRFVKVK